MARLFLKLDSFEQNLEWLNKTTNFPISGILCNKCDWLEKVNLTGEDYILEIGLGEYIKNISLSVEDLKEEVYKIVIFYGEQEADQDLEKWRTVEDRLYRYNYLLAGGRKRELSEIPLCKNIKLGNRKKLEIKPLPKIFGKNNLEEYGFLSSENWIGLCKMGKKLSQNNLKEKAKQCYWDAYESSGRVEPLVFLFQGPYVFLLGA